MGKFSVSTSIYWNEEIKESIKKINDKKIFVVCDNFLVSSPILKEYINQLNAANQVIIFSDVVPDPPMENVIAGIKVYKQANPDIVLAVGGGSAIDTAKAIYYFVQKLELSSKKKLIAMPTTSGTGSEVTSVAVVTETEKNSKYPIVCGSILPDEAWLDAEFIKSCPAQVTASSGIDVLTHALEALVAKDSSSFTDVLAISAIKTVFEMLPVCYQSTPSKNELMKLHQASCMAGIAFQNAGLGICHAVSHQLGGMFHLPHGLLNGMLLPNVIKLNCQSEIAKEKYISMSKILQIAKVEESDEQVINKLISKIEKLKNNLESSKKLSDFNVCQNQVVEGLPQMISKAKTDFTFSGNPYIPPDNEIAKLILSIY